VAKAKQEGEVVIYLGRAGSRQLIEAFKPFEQKYGVKATPVVGSGNENADKILAERDTGIYTADVWMGGLTTMNSRLVPKGAFDPIEPLLEWPEEILALALHREVDDRRRAADRRRARGLRERVPRPDHLSVEPDVRDPDVDVRVDRAGQDDAAARVDPVAAPGRLDRGDRLAVDEHVRLARALGRDDETASDSRHRAIQALKAAAAAGNVGRLAPRPREGR
jgi:hypothetical protein